MTKKIDFKIEQIDINELNADENNPRVISPKMLTALESSIDNFDFNENIVVCKEGLRYRIISGHQRVTALKELGYTHVPAIIKDWNDENKIRAYNVAANQIKGDFDNLAEYMEPLLDTPEIEWTGLDDLDLEDIKIDLGIIDAKEDDFDADEAAGRIKNPATKPGDLYIIDGKHRLLCGDSTKKEDVDRLMDGKQADMVFTDPPYNLAGEALLFVASDIRSSCKKLKDSQWDKNFDPLSVLPIIKEVLATNATVYICTSHYLFGIILSYCKENYDFINWCVWNKPNPMPSLSKRHWTWNAELIVYATQGKHIFNFPYEGHALQTWTFTSPSHTTGHPTEKPITIPSHGIIHSSKEGMLILDLFLGSGTTLIAAEQLNRICYGIEIDPVYCDVIIERYKKLKPDVKIQTISKRSKTEMSS